MGHNISQPVAFQELSSDQYPVVAEEGFLANRFQASRRNYHHVEWNRFQALVLTPPSTTKYIRTPPKTLTDACVPWRRRYPKPGSNTCLYPDRKKKKSEKKRIALVRHRRGCKNENTSFSEICILYPQIPVQYLWDLFENCNGHGDWTANLLLEEQKAYEFETADNLEAGEVGGLLAIECDCNETMVLQVPSGDPSGSGGGGGGYEIDRSTVNLISKLHATFKDKHGSGTISLDELTNERTKVFMATEMAEQLYLSFLDSMYSCRGKTRFYEKKKYARLAQQMEAKEKYPVLFKMTIEDSPSLNDIMEMEYALTAYRREINGWAKQAPQDLASHMTRQKLAEMYPIIDEKVLAEILYAHKFSDAITVLNNSIPEELRNQIARKREALMKRAEAEKQKALPSSSTSPPPTVEQVPSSSEDDINLHLKTAEECRNMSQDHQELKNECHEKARNAIQWGMAGVAEYYVQVASLHRTKIDMYSSKASNAIMEVHKLTLNNVDVLDLHYPHSEEALQCLEIFPTEHARKLTHRTQQFKELFIITGRELYSADGIPIIKHRVKAMLRDLGLRSPQTPNKPGNEMREIVSTVGSSKFQSMPIQFQSKAVSNTQEFTQQLQS
ncbi:uncharacterized protein LOC135700094 [Ochlerotatus camptorhynchus]|uniref:uncharacterized protein LOC135700094 n=1 Tax=Ochlerotatus camptorhynchus TaxID=644619 RepID=UPI0031DA3A85